MMFNALIKRVSVSSTHNTKGKDAVMILKAISDLSTTQEEKTANLQHLAGVLTCIRSSASTLPTRHVTSTCESLGNLQILDSGGLWKSLFQKILQTGRSAAYTIEEINIILNALLYSGKRNKAIIQHFVQNIGHTLKQQSVPKPGQAARLLSTLGKLGVDDEVCAKALFQQTLLELKTHPRSFPPSNVIPCFFSAVKFGLVSKEWTHMLLTHLRDTWKADFTYTQSSMIWFILLKTPTPFLNCQMLIKSVAKKSFPHFEKYSMRDVAGAMMALWAHRCPSQLAQPLVARFNECLKLPVAASGLTCYHASTITLLALLLGCQSSLHSAASFRLIEKNLDCSDETVTPRVVQNTLSAISRLPMKDDLNHVMEKLISILLRTLQSVDQKHLWSYVSSLTRLGPYHASKKYNTLFETSNLIPTVFKCAYKSLLQMTNENLARASLLRLLKFMIEYHTNSVVSTHVDKVLTYYCERIKAPSAEEIETISHALLSFNIRNHGPILTYLGDRILAPNSEAKNMFDPFGYVNVVRVFANNKAQGNGDVLTALLNCVLQYIPNMNMVVASRLCATLARMQEVPKNFKVIINMLVLQCDKLMEKNNETITWVAAAMVLLSMARCKMIQIPFVIKVETALATAGTTPEITTLVSVMSSLAKMYSHNLASHKDFYALFVAKLLTEDCSVRTVVTGLFARTTVQGIFTCHLTTQNKNSKPTKLLRDLHALDVQVKEYLTVQYLESQRDNISGRSALSLIWSLHVLNIATPTVTSFCYKLLLVNLNEGSLKPYECARLLWVLSNDYNEKLTGVITNMLDSYPVNEIDPGTAAWALDALVRFRVKEKVRQLFGKIVGVIPLLSWSHTMPEITCRALLAWNAASRIPDFELQPNERDIGTDAMLRGMRDVIHRVPRVVIPELHKQLQQLDYSSEGRGPIEEISSFLLTFS